MPDDITFEQPEANVIVAKIPLSCTGEQWIMLSGDRHHDNLYCDWALEKRHLEKAVERKALLLDVGDLHCAMQGKYDPRSDMRQIRPEHVGDDYLDRLVSTATDFYAPYISKLPGAIFGTGNHETNVSNRHGTNLTSNLVHRLNTAGGRCFMGGYGGWVKLQFIVSKTMRTSINIKYHHGAGSGGPVTRGVIQTNRQAVYLPDADVVVNGHTHDSWVVPIARERINTQGIVRRDLVWFVRTPGYKDEYRNGSGGFHIEKWGPPKPLGCVWLRVAFEQHPFRARLEAIQDIE